MKVVLKPGETLEIVAHANGGFSRYQPAVLRMSGVTQDGGVVALAIPLRSMSVVYPDLAASADQPQQPKPPVQPAEAPADDMSERRVPRYEDQPGGRPDLYAMAH